MPEWFQLDYVQFFSRSQYDSENDNENIKSSFCISYFERYKNSKSEYLEFLSSVFLFQTAEI